MLRFHFETGDFARVRFVPRPAPLVELKVALMMSQRSDSAVLFGRWRRDIGHRLPPTTRPLWELLQPLRGGPAFLDPVTPDLEEALELVRARSGRHPGDGETAIRADTLDQGAHRPRGLRLGHAGPRSP